MDKFTVQIRPARDSIYSGGFLFRPLEGQDGHLLAGAHGDERGGLWAENIKAMAVIKADNIAQWAPKGPIVVMPCYPLAVQARHPELHVVGDWEGETVVSYDGHHVVRAEPYGA